MSKTNGMADYDLGDIKKVDNLQSVWPHEAYNFTRWLAEEENLNLLSEAVGMEKRIKLVETESRVGNFSVDILAKDEDTQTNVVIENQLKPANHDHLGKVITYASGVNARVAIWIVKEAGEEHRRAIDWLNEHTDESLAFFLVQIELWQIDDSKKAPRFEVISKPNEWAKAAKRSVNRKRLWTSYTFFGEKYSVENATQLFVGLFNRLIDKEDGFVEKLRQKQPSWWTGKRNFIAESPEAVYQREGKYSDRNRSSSAKRLSNGQFIDTNFGIPAMERRIETVCEIFEIEFDKDIILHEK